MDAMKFGWIGRTVALARNNVSGPRKSRVRLTKKERKEIVESFIHKYQQLNGGRFPLPTLTRNKVGGSYYIVREIVREATSKNRVLDPSDVSPVDHKIEELLQDRPLGTVSVQPQMEHNITWGVDHQCETEKEKKDVESVAAVNGRRCDISNGQPCKIDPSDKNIGNFRSPADMLTKITTTADGITEVSPPHNQSNPTGSFGVKADTDEIFYEENRVSATEVTLVKDDDGKVKFQDQYHNIKDDTVNEKTKLNSSIATLGHLIPFEDCLLDARDFLEPEEVEHTLTKFRTPPQNELINQKVPQSEIDTTSNHLSSCDDHSGNSPKEEVSPDRSNIDGAAEEHCHNEGGNSLFKFLRNMVASFKFWSHR